MCELTSALLPTGYARSAQVRFLPTITRSFTIGSSDFSDYSRSFTKNTEDVRDTTRHVWISATWHGWATAGARHGKCELALKLSQCDPRQALRDPEFEASRILRQSANGNVVSPTHRPPLPYKEDPWCSFLLETWVDPRAIMLQKTLQDLIGKKNTGLFGL